MALSAVIGAGTGCRALPRVLGVVSSPPGVLSMKSPWPGWLPGSYAWRRILHPDLLAEVYTTAVANLYGFSARIVAQDSLRFKLVTVVAGSGALLAGSVGVHQPREDGLPCGRLGRFRLPRRSNCPRAEGRLR